MFPEIPDKYEASCIIGKGGQGIVYKVKTKEDNTNYALKSINISGRSNKKARKQIRSEINCLKKLKHPGVVRIYSAQETNHQVFLQMDLVNGIKLTNAINEADFSYDSSIEIMMKLLSTMSYVHRKKVAHLDIKPDNIILRKDQMPIIIDLGCSLNLDSIKKNYKKKDDQLLTVEYVAPEILIDSNEKFNPKLADIYSLGATFYTMLTQKNVYNNIDQHTYAMSSSGVKKVQAPHLICNTIPEKISEICMKSIRENPHDRFQSCKEFYDDLKLALK